MANHLTPSELADELHMKRQEVIGKCVEMGVPIFHGRIDKSLFETSLRQPDGPAGPGAGLGRLDVSASPRLTRLSPSMGRGTEISTLADLLPRAAEIYGDAPAVRYKDGDAWVDRSFTEVARHGPLALARPDRPRRREGRQGLDPRQHPPRVDLLRLRRALGRRDRRPDLPDQLARGVPVRARELRRQGRRRRGRRAAGEDPRGPRPAAAAGARGADDRHQRRRDLDRATSPRAAPAATPPSGRRAGRRSTPDDICTFIYTSGTTGPPKGCVISHGNYRAMLDMVNETSVIEDEDVTYLYLPLAHSFALLIQLGSFDLGATLAYWERDPLKIVPNLAELKPTYFPSVPRIFEKIYTTATSAMEKEGGLKKAIFDWSIRVGRRCARPSARAASRASCCASSTSSPTRRCSRRSAACSAASCASRSPARRRSTPTSCASSTPPGCSCSRAGG